MIKATYILILITATVYFFELLSYSTRLVVFRTKQYNLTSSLFNIVTLGAKFAQTFQAPLLGVLIDVSIQSGTSPLRDFRMVLMSATAGLVLGALIFPTFLSGFSGLVRYVAQNGGLKGIRSLQGRSKEVLTRLKFKWVGLDLDLWPMLKRHKRILLLNVLVYSLYSVGILSAYYAAFLYPSHRLTLAGFSGTVNAFASLLLILYLEPVTAKITDDVYNEDRPYTELKALVFISMSSRLIGTVLGQLLLVPAAKWMIILFQFLT